MNKNEKNVQKNKKSASSILFHRFVRFMYVTVEI